MIEGEDYTVKELLFLVILEFRSESLASKFKDSDVPERFRKDFDLNEKVRAYKQSNLEVSRYRRMLEVHPDGSKNRISLLELKEIIP